MNLKLGRFLLPTGTIGSLGLGAQRTARTKQQKNGRLEEAGHWPPGAVGAAPEFPARNRAGLTPTRGLNRTALRTKLRALGLAVDKIVTRDARTEEEDK